jgi:sugar phosphate permease
MLASKYGFAFSLLYNLFCSPNNIVNFIGLGLTSLYFVVTGIQFWGASYMLVALNVSRIYVDTMFVFCASTAPTLGVFFGAWIVDKLGGYHGLSQRVFTLKLCLTNCNL